MAENLSYLCAWRRHRGWYAVWIVLVIIAGKSVRSDLLNPQNPIADFTGDALWALMWFLVLGFLWPRGRTIYVALLAAGFGCGIEFSQLSHASLLEDLRPTLFGKWILGATFARSDIAAYLLGVGFGAVVEWVWRLS